MQPSHSCSHGARVSSCRGAVDRRLPSLVAAERRRQTVSSASASASASASIPAPVAREEEVPARSREADFAAWYLLRAESVRRCASKLGACEAAIEDIVQDVFIIALREWSSHGDVLPSRGWLIRVATYLVLRHRRTEGRRARKHDAFAQAAAVQQIPGAANDETTIESEWVDRLLIAQGLLAHDERLRRVFLLRVGLGYSNLETANEVQVSVRTVIDRVERARAQLRDQVSAGE